MSFQWDIDQPLEEVHLRYLPFGCSARTHDELKKKLYCDIIRLFDEGDVRNANSSLFSSFVFLLNLFRRGKKRSNYVKNYKFNTKNRSNTNI